MSIVVSNVQCVYLSHYQRVINTLRQIYELLYKLVVRNFLLQLECIMLEKKLIFSSHLLLGLGILAQVFVLVRRNVPLSAV